MLAETYRANSKHTTATHVLSGLSTDRLTYTDKYNNMHI